MENYLCTREGFMQDISDAYGDESHSQLQKKYNPVYTLSTFA